MNEEETKAAVMELYIKFGDRGMDYSDVAPLINIGANKIMTKNEKFKDLCMELYLKYGGLELEGPLLQGSHRPAVERVGVTMDSFGQHKFTYKLTPEALELIRS